MCLTRFTLAPLRPGAWQALSLWCHGALLALACLLLLAATGGAQAVAATGWQHVALLTLLLLLGARWGCWSGLSACSSHALPCLCYFHVELGRARGSSAYLR